jgi:hypothetical protein
MVRVFRKKFLKYEFHRPFCNALTKNTDLNRCDISFVRNSIGNLAEGSEFCFAFTRVGSIKGENSVLPSTVLCLTPFPTAPGDMYVGVLHLDI